MKEYDYIPRPLIESHPHIRMLFEAQEKSSTERNEHRDRQKSKDEREELIRDTPGYVLTDFYCYECKEDFKAQAIKEVEVDWSNPAQNVAFYRTKCFKGHWCQRRITDKHSDPYWMNSKAVAKDRGKNHNAILQPFETGYNLLYANKNKQ